MNTRATRVALLLICGVVTAAAIFFAAIEAGYIKLKLGAEQTARSLTREEEIKKFIEEYNGNAVEEKYQPFETKIRGLMSYGADGVYNSGWSQEKIDMNARRQYFTDNGWLGYMQYIGGQKSKLSGAEHVSGKFKYKSQKYEQLSSGLWKFQANGNLENGAYDVYSVGDPFLITLITKTPPENVNGMIIDAWQIIILPKEKN